MVPQHADVKVQSVKQSGHVEHVTLDVMAVGENTLLIPQQHRSTIDVPIGQQPKVGDELRLVLIDTKTHHVELNS